MLIFAIVALAAVIMIILGIVFEHMCEYYDASAFFYVFGVIALIVALIMGGVIWHDYAYKDVYTESYRMRYETLTAQYENGYYDRITYDGREGLMDKIIKYNETVIINRSKHNSIWIGAFYPEDWESLPLIDIKKTEETHDKN